MTAAETGPALLIVGNYPPPYGGVPKHIEDLVPDLVRRGWRVHVLSGGRGGIEVRDGVTIHRDGRSWVRRRLDTVGFLRKARVLGGGAAVRAYGRMAPARRWVTYVGRAALGAQIVEDAGIELISGYNLTSGAPVASLLGEVYDLPVVISNFGEIYSDRAVIDAERALIRRMTQRAARLTCMTQHCANSYRLIGLDPDVRIVPYGIDLDRFSPGDGTEVRASLGFAPEDRVVLYVGRMIADMGVDTMLEAARLVAPAVPRARFVVAGGRGDLTPAAERLAAELPGRVRVLVDVPGERLAELYRAADLVVVPTKGARACGSLAAGEAAATAVAVVGARVGGVPEYIVEGETGVLVPPDSPAAFADAVTDLLRDDARRTAMGAAGLAFVRRRFRAAATNQAMAELLSEALAERTPSLPSHRI